MLTDNSRDLGQYLYDRLPDIYRKRDSEEGIDYALLRFLQVLNEGGITTLFNEMLELYDILQVDKMPSDIVPLIGQLLGYNYRDDFEEDIQRKIIQNLIELYKRKGTKSVLNFITREFTKYDAKAIETEYRIFKTWSPEPKGIPQSEYVEPRTLGLSAPDEDTCHLISVDGKYDGHSVIVTFDSTEERIKLLNTLLVDFMPVYCKLYLTVKGELNRTSFEDSISIQSDDSNTSLKIKMELKDEEDVRVVEELHKLAMKDFSQEIAHLQPREKQLDKYTTSTLESAKVKTTYQNVDTDKTVFGNIVTSTSSLTFTEGESTEFSVKLDKKPTGSQIVHLSSNGLSLTPTYLTFTPSNYSTYQQVTVNAYSSGSYNIVLSSNKVGTKTIPVTVNEVVIEIPQLTEYEQSCTSEYILDKMYPMGQRHEAIPSGNITDTWKYNTRWENPERPISTSHDCSDISWGQCSNPQENKPFSALGCWSNIYRVEGTPFTSNTGVEMKDIKVYGWYNGQWELVQHLPVPNGNFYAESFGGDSSQHFSDSVKQTNTSKTIILRETNKITSMNWNTMQPQTENCMYHPFSNIKLFDTKYQYIYTCIDLRKVKWDENGIDDRDSTHYCSNCGGDWWREENLAWHSSWQHNCGVAQPKMIELTNEWRRFSMTTVPQNWPHGFPK